MIKTSQYTPELAAAYLALPDFAFDTETDARNYHWGENEDKTDKKRGLSYAADITYLSFYAGPSLPAMVLKATPIRVERTREVVQDGEILEIPTLALQYSFQRKELGFIWDMFTRETYTAVAHNLVFDSRQIIGKLFGEWQAPEGGMFWDTSTINTLGRWVIPEYGKENLSLADLEKHYDLLDPDVRSWWGSMKSYRDKLHLLAEDTEEAAVYRKKLTRVSLPPNEITEDRGGKGWTLKEGQRAVDLYSALDSVVAYEVYHKQRYEEKRYLITPTPSQPYACESWNDLLYTDLDYTKWCSQVSARGIKANVPYITQKRQEYFNELRKAAEDLGFTQPEDVFEPRAKTWQHEYIFSIIEEPSQEEVHNHPYLRTKGGAWSASADALSHYIESHPELESLKRYTDADTKFKRADEFLRHSEYDGRIHSTLDRNTITGRNSSSQPNIQNLNFPSNAGYLIADEGFVLCEFDYSNAENWIQTMYSRDDNFALACAQEDFHSAMAAQYFPDEWAEAKRNGDTAKLKALRFAGKQFTFGIPYGMTAKSLVKKMKLETGQDWTLEQAQAVIDKRMQAFPMAALAQEKSAKFAESNGYTPLWTGRQISILKFNNHYKGYTAWNSLAQGGVGEMVVRAILKINKFLEENGYRTWVATQIHDSLIICLCIEEYHQVVPAIIDIMAHIIPEEWNQRTTPNVRWLTDLEHVTNSKKWGYVPGQDYPFDLKKYYNGWGEHELPEGAKERPVWINEKGYGQAALYWEQNGTEMPTALYGEVPTNPEPFYQDPEPVECGYDWAAMQTVFEQARPIFKLYSYKGKMFAFPEAMELFRALCHKGQNMDYLDFIAMFDQLADVMGQYARWRKDGGGNC
jgi:hypothetical protein